MKRGVLIISFILLSGSRTLLLAADSPARAIYPQPNFAVPPVYSVAGSEVGITGINSMAQGDFNGDGIPDIAVAGFGGSNGKGSPGNSIAVYLGKGDGTFKPPVYYAAGPFPIEVISGHLLGPNAPEDLIVVDAGEGNNITVLLGNGDGTFQPPLTGASFPSALTAVAVGDFNGDGKPDLAVAAYGGSGTSAGLVNTVGILLGNGNGTFQPPAFYQSVNNPYAIALGDFNKDGKLDVVIMNPDGLYLSLGNGDGTFLPGCVILAEPSTLISANPPGPILNGPVSFLVADLNGDGNLDIAADIDGTRVDVLLGTGAGTFVPASTPSYLINAHETGFGGGQIATAKLTNSDKLDLVVATGYGATLAILYGNGDGTFQTPLIYPCAEADDAAFVVADVNGDGHLDIVVGTSEGALTSETNYLAVLLNQGNAGFGAPPPLVPTASPASNKTANPTNPVGVELADLTGNGKLDLVVTDFDLPIEPLINGQVPTPPTINPAAGQINNHGSISVLAGNGDGTFQSEQQYYVGGRPIAVKVGDLTGDGKKDIAVVNAFENTLSILKANGDRTFKAAISIPVGTNPNALVLADFNGDGKLDIAVTNLVDNNISVLINQSSPGNLSFKTPVTYAVGTYPAGIVARDFNHDGTVDLAVVNDGYFFGADPNTTLAILKGNGDGTFQSATTQLLWNGSGGDAITSGDFGTGQVDLAVANFSRGEVMVLHGQGNGTFTQANKYRVGAGPEGIVAMDFNGDGTVDLAVNDINDNTVGLLLGKGDGTFLPVVSGADDIARPFGWSTWGYPAYMAAGDINGDGKPDIIVSNLFEAAVTVLRNTTITPPPVNLVSVVSRKIHGSAGTFDVDLPLVGNPGIECRSGGANGDYTLIFTFANTLTRVGGAGITTGTGAVGSSGVDAGDAHRCIVTLTGVTDAQLITVSLTNVIDSAANYSATVSVKMNVLIGDTNADTTVNSGDIGQTKSQSGQIVTSANFRQDLNADGSVNSGDIALAKSKSGTALR